MFRRNRPLTITSLVLVAVLSLLLSTSPVHAQCSGRGGQMGQRGQMGQVANLLPGQMQGQPPIQALVQQQLLQQLVQQQVIQQQLILQQIQQQLRALLQQNPDLLTTLQQNPRLFALLQQAILQQVLVGQTFGATDLQAFLTRYQDQNGGPAGQSPGKGQAFAGQAPPSTP
jgi:hypothetical protein